MSINRMKYRALSRKSATRGGGRLRFKQAGQEGVQHAIEQIEAALEELRSLLGGSGGDGEGEMGNEGETAGKSFGWAEDFLAGRTRTKASREAVAEARSWLEDFVGEAERVSAKSGGTGRYLDDPFAGSPFERGGE